MVKDLDLEKMTVEEVTDYVRSLNEEIICLNAYIRGLKKSIGIDELIEGAKEKKVYEY